MHTNTISIILLVKTPVFLTAVLKNLNKQKGCAMEIIAIIADKYKDIAIISDSLDITIIYKASKLINPYILFEILPRTKGNYISVVNSYDLSSAERFIKQVNYLKENKNIQIVSSLEKSFNEKESVDNIFITSKEIEAAIESFYLPLNIYTFLFRRAFLVYMRELNIKLNHLYISKERQYKEVNFILQLLKYTKIEKVAEILYMARYPRDRKSHRKIKDYSLNSLSPLYIYNKNKYIERREYLKSAITITRVNGYSYSKSLSLNKINILVICTTLNIGGTESYLFNLWRALKALNINVMVLSSEGVMAEVFSLEGMNIFQERELKPYDKCKDYFFIREIIAKYNIKVLLCETDDCIQIVAKISKIVNIPAVLQLHGLYYTKSIIKKYNMFFHDVICISDNVKKYYFKYFTDQTIKNKLKVVPNFIDANYRVKTKELFLHHKLKLISDAKILLYVSRLSYSKGILCENFLDTFFKLAKSDSKLYAVVIGDGERFTYTVEQALYFNNLLKEKRIFVIGAVYELVNYYSDSVLVIGTGRVALEALSCFTPVLAYGLAGCGGIVSKKNINKMIESNFYDHSFDDIAIKKESEDTLGIVLKEFIYDKRGIYKNIQWLQRYMKYLSSDKVAPIIKELINSAINAY